MDNELTRLRQIAYAAAQRFHEATQACYDPAQETVDVSACEAPFMRVAGEYDEALKELYNYLSTLEQTELRAHEAARVNRMRELLDIEIEATQRYLLLLREGPQ